MPYLFILYYSGAVRPIKASPAGVPQESTDWLGMLWTFAASLVAPEDEEEGIHQLTEILTRKNTSSHTNQSSNDETDISNKMLISHGWHTEHPVVS